jgi:hypothetical protein
MRVGATIVAVEKQHYVLCVAELDVTVTHIKILNVAQLCFYDKLLSQATIKLKYVCM